MVRDKTGIQQAGKGRFLVRVKRIEARTGLMANRKATVLGTFADAERVRDELRRQLASTVEKRAPIRLKAYAESWLRRRVERNEIRDSVARKYGYSLRHILPILGDLYVHTITRADVEGYVALRKAEAGIKGGNTVLNELRLIRTIAKDTVAEGYASADWAARIKPPKVRKYSKERPNRFTPHQAFVLLAKIPERWQALVLLMMSTGLRWGEASALHWEDIDRKTGEATIKWGNDRGTLVLVKTDSSYRSVPIEPEILKLLGLRRDVGLVFPVTRGPRKGKLNAGYPLVNMLKRICKQVGIPYTTPHGLRRTFNNLGRQITERDILKAMSGHATDVMVEHYSHVELGEKQAASKAILAMIRAAKTQPSDIVPDPDVEI
jgi:integrase